MQRHWSWLGVTVVAGGALLLADLDSSRAGDWPGWRGPTGLGFSEETDLPLTWGGREAENVLWKVPLSGRGPESPGFSSPIVWRDRVFITTVRWPPALAEEAMKGPVLGAPEHHVLCYQVTDGKRIWDTVIRPGPCRLWKSAPGYAVPTPTTDGEHLFVLFGSAAVACLDFEGRVVWRKELPGPFPAHQAQASCGSPVVHQGIVVVSYFRDFYRLLGVNKDNGQVKWESKESHNCSTPVLISVKGKKQLLVHATHTIQGLDPGQGKVLWSCTGHGAWCTPTYGCGLVYADSGSDGLPGVVVDPTGVGEVTKTHLRWQTGRLPDGFASPIIVGDHVYRVQQPGVVTCRKLTTGELVYSERLPGVSLWSSPFATADGRIYFVSPNKSYVIKAGPKFQILATSDLRLGGTDYTSPAVSRGRLFVKGQTLLCSIGTR